MMPIRRGTLCTRDALQSRTEPVAVLSFAERAVGLTVRNNSARTRYLDRLEADRCYHGGTPKWEMALRSISSAFYGSGLWLRVLARWTLLAGGIQGASSAAWAPPLSDVASRARTGSPRHAPSSQ